MLTGTTATQITALLATLNDNGNCASPGSSASDEAECEVSIQCTGAIEVPIDLGRVGPGICRRPASLRTGASVTASRPWPTLSA